MSLFLILSRVTQINGNRLIRQITKINNKLLTWWMLHRYPSYFFFSLVLPLFLVSVTLTHYSFVKTLIVNYVFTLTIKIQ